MSEIFIPPIEAVIDRQAELIEEHGGASVLRDLGLLESALSRAQNLQAYGGEVSVFQVAATVAFGISQNQAFIDGNKRSAFDTLGIILIANGQWLDVSQTDAFEAMMAIAKGEHSEERLAEWLERNCVPQVV
ncbi:MAG: type II toxin-antitoxin system death-on-curing family toxin [Proteobacteria bacterium]|nr:type II toxin-antitoxin system death-on-curing family toxin [Pseudomonadota bacterium]